MPFVLEEKLGRVFLLNQETGDLWEIDRDKFTHWNCVGVIPVAPSTKPEPAPGSDRFELVGTDTAVIDGVTYHGQVQPDAQPDELGVCHDPDGPCELTISKRLSLHEYEQVLKVSNCETKKLAWETFDNWVKGCLPVTIPTIEARQPLEAEEYDPFAPV